MRGKRVLKKLPDHDLQLAILFLQMNLLIAMLMGLEIIVKEFKHGNSKIKFGAYELSQGEITTRNLMRA